MTRQSVRRVRTASVLAAVAVAAPLAAPAPALAVYPVIDVANLTQSLVQSARLLDQINNQVRALQNQETLLQDEARNLQSLGSSPLPALTADLQQIGGLMDQAQGVGFDLQSVEGAFSRRYPDGYASGTGIPQVLGDAEARWQDARDAFRQTMLMQSAIVRTLPSDTATLGGLVDASQGAAGSLQAQQATNQLLALSIKQQMQIQTLLAAQGRAQALKDAGGAEAQAAGKAAFSSFLGSPDAYSPQ